MALDRLDAVPAWLWVAGGGAVGAVARHAVANWSQTRFGEGFPIGTLLVNVSGSLLLGLVLGMALAGRLSPTTKLALGSGFLGAFTTFSTFSCDTIHLLEAGRHGAALGYVAANVLLGALAAALGFTLARWIA